MNDLIAYPAALVLGMALGAGYFGGLWMTIRRLPVSRNPGILALGSLLVRQALCGVVFILVVRGGHWDRLGFALLGFLVMRRILVRMVRESVPGSRPSIPEGYGISGGAGLRTAESDESHDR